MGIFDAPFKSKECKDLYDNIKWKLYEFLKNPQAEDVQTTLNQSQSQQQQQQQHSSAEIQSAEQKLFLKNIRKGLEAMPSPQTNVYQLDFSGKELSPECLIALIRALNIRNEKNQLVWPVSSLNLSGTQFMSNNKVGPKGAKKNSELQKIMEETLCLELNDFLNGSRTLDTIDLSNNLLGKEFITKFMLQGLRYNSSVKNLILKTITGDAKQVFPELLVEIMVKSSAPQSALRSVKRFDSAIAVVNMSLRSVDFSYNSPSKEATYLLVNLANEATRLTTLKFMDDPKKVTLNGTTNTLEDILERNAVITGIMDGILGSVLGKRSFKEKLDNFKSSIKENRMKGKAGSGTVGAINSNDGTPIYKVIAQQNEDGGRFDPYHPIIYPSSRWKVGYAISVGRREEMQDVVALRGKFRETTTASGVGTDQSSKSKHEDWWAIYDGHGGREAAAYAAENLHQLVASHMDKAGGNPTPTQRCEAIKNAFRQCQKEMAPWNTIAGTTVLSLYIHDHKRYIVNLGDSRAILYNNKTKITRLLTRDHRANDPNEKKRIQALNGSFIEDGKVNGKLTVTRALGDSSLVPYISCVPDVEYEDIQEDDDFIVLASDGLWDVFQGEGDNPVEKTSVVTAKNMETFMNGCKTVTEIVKKCSTAPIAAKKLVEYAYEHSSNDNISVIVVFLNRQAAGVKQGATANRPSGVPMNNPLFKGDAKTVERASSANAAAKVPPQGQNEQQKKTDELKLINKTKTEIKSESTLNTSSMPAKPILEKQASMASSLSDSKSVSDEPPPPALPDLNKKPSNLSQNNVSQRQPAPRLHSVGAEKKVLVVQSMGSIQETPPSDNETTSIAATKPGSARSAASLPHSPSNAGSVTARMPDVSESEVSIASQSTINSTDQTKKSSFFTGGPAADKRSSMHRSEKSNTSVSKSSSTVNTSNLSTSMGGNNNNNNGVKKTESLSSSHGDGSSLKLMMSSAQLQAINQYSMGGSSNDRNGSSVADSFVDEMLAYLNNVKFSSTTSK